MNIIVRGKNIEVTPALKDYVEKRIGKLEKFFDGFENAQVKLAVEGEQHKVEVTMPLNINGLILRGEEATGDMYASIDLVVEKLEKQIERHKGRLFEKRKSLDVTAAAPSEESEDQGPKIVKTKRFAIKPMSVDEAVLQMSLLGHSFFVFTNADTDQVNVVYKRKDGNFGLIEPEFE